VNAKRYKKNGGGAEMFKNQYQFISPLSLELDQMQEQSENANYIIVIVEK
jgi:hypothetical protein